MLPTSEGHFRVTHNRDPVPHLPMIAMGYSHIRTEVFYNWDNSAFKVCSTSDGEDKTCSDQFLLPLVITDHLNYVGFDFIGNYLSCKL